jgi:protoheme IX farnesyltransferase
MISDPAWYRISNSAVLPLGLLAARGKRRRNSVLESPLTAGDGEMANPFGFRIFRRALTTLVVYLIVYTPMKRRSSLATLVGAVPGALPPLIGWAASHGGISLGGAALFLIVFLWQIPHFMAIAWLYRDDYGKAGFPMLPVIDPDGKRAGKQAVYWALLMVLASLEPNFSGLAGNAYLAVALVFGVGLFWLAVRFAAARNEATARALFYGSITYLPLLWIAMIANKQ